MFVRNQAFVLPLANTLAVYAYSSNVNPVA
jgi:hypothetical protein